MGAPESEFSDTLASLTAKQRETIALIGDGRANKEIATELDISLSAAIQRVENLRAKFGNVSKADLGRIWREHDQAMAQGTCNPITGNNNHLSDTPFFAPEGSRNQNDAHLYLADSLLIETNPPWTRKSEPSVVPEELDGANATTLRGLIVVAMAIGMAVLLLVMLAVANVVGEVWW
jgi:DNA-binding CsgD family transcriptional regulator